MVCLGLAPGATGWKVQTHPLTQSQSLRSHKFLPVLKYSSQVFVELNLWPSHRQIKKFVLGQNIPPFGLPSSPNCPFKATILLSRRPLKSSVNGWKSRRSTPTVFQSTNGARWSWTRHLSIPSSPFWLKNSSPCTWAGRRLLKPEWGRNFSKASSTPSTSADSKQNLKRSTITTSTKRRSAARERTKFARFLLLIKLGQKIRPWCQPICICRPFRRHRSRINCLSSFTSQK